MQTIFISVAAYRDDEVNKTIQSALSCAHHPERVVIGLFNQIAQEDERMVVAEHPQIRQITIPHTDSRGVCWARHNIFKRLLKDEDIVLQIDSHSRFDVGWDTLIEEQLNDVGDDRAILSHYPLTYVPLTEERGPKLYVRFAVKELGKHGFPILSNSTVHAYAAPDYFEETAFIAGGCFFTKASVVKNVPYDPYLYFTGEEVNYAIRLWTHGYNIYLPTKSFLYHDYHAPRAFARYNHSSDNPDTYNRMWGASMARMQHILGIQESNDIYVTQRCDEFCLGKERSLVEWQYRFGVHFTKQLLTKNAKEGFFGK